MKIESALISVFEKDGIEDFAQGLSNLGIKILASGGTAKTLENASISVRDVAEMVGGGAILGHKVVTLSREVHAGLLARRGVDDDEMKQLGLPFIDLVCVDLYPLKEEIAKPNSTLESVIEKTDIGGPTMIRSGAKGRKIVICDPEDRMKVVKWIKEGCPNEETVLSWLISKAERIVSEYCLASAEYHNPKIANVF